MPNVGSRVGEHRPPPSLGILPHPDLSSPAPWMQLCSRSPFCSHCQQNNAAGSAQVGACVARPVGKGNTFY